MSAITLLLFYTTCKQQTPLWQQCQQDETSIYSPVHEAQHWGAVPPNTCMTNTFPGQQADQVEG